MVIVQRKVMQNITKKLSAKRAQAVVDVLINEFGIKASRLTAIGHGETKLLDKDNTAAAHEKNRRIEATVSTTKKTAVKC